MRKLFTRPVVLSCVGVLLTVIWLFGWRGFIGVPGQWGEEPNEVFWPWGAWPLPLGVLLIFGGAGGLSVYDRYKRAKNRKEQRNSIFTALVALIILNLLLPWALLGPGYEAKPKKVVPGQPIKITLEGRANIIAAMWSDVATQYFGTAYEIEDARQFCHEYADKWQYPTSTSLAHVATHPPGAVLFFYGVRRLTEQVPDLGSGLNSLAATMTQTESSKLYDLVDLLRATSSRSAGVAVPKSLPTGAVGAAVLSAFLLNLALATCIPAIFGIAAFGAPDEATGDARGLLAAGLFVLAPSLNLFAFTLDALVAAGVVWTLYGVARAVNSGSNRWLWFSGACFALTAFVSISVLAVGLIVLLTLWWFRRPTLPWKDAAHWCAGTLAALAVILLLFPFNPIAVVLNAMAAHKFATLLYRAWLPWFFLNFVLFAIFCGWPVIAGLVDGLLGEFRFKEKLWPGLVIGAATLVTIVLLSLSGNVRGEVERLWLFLLAPLIVAIIPKPDWKSSAALLTLQAVQTLCMAATLAPLVRPI